MNDEREKRIKRLADCGYIYKRISKHWFLVRMYATPKKLLYHLVLPKYIK